LFGMPTVHALNAEKVDEIRHAYLTRYPKLKSTLTNLFASVTFDEPDDFETEDLRASAEKELEEQGAFDPTGIKDARTRVLSSIVLRQGQPAFRKRLLTAYNRRCAITGCSVESVLEAAHIVPYKGEITNHLGNGLLLRADFHTLFDLRLIAIDEVKMRLLVSPKLNGTGYDNYRGKKVRIPKEESSRPSREALEQQRLESGLG
jgi:putative restriction endonuclease